MYVQHRSIQLTLLNNARELCILAMLVSETQLNYRARI